MANRQPSEMKRKIIFVLVLLLLVVGTYGDWVRPGKKDTEIFNNVIITGNLSAKRPYAMFSDNTTQRLTAALTAFPVNFSNTENAYQIMKTGRSNITFQQTGDYMIEISAIVDTALPNKHIEMWVEKNGVAIPRSNTKLEVTSATTEAIIAVPFIISMTKNDTMRIMWASDDAGSTLVFTPSTSYSPSSPSIIMTIAKVSEIP